MNHSVSYLPTHAFHATREENYTLYDALMAAITDINITLPASQKIVLGVQDFGNTYSLSISQNGVSLCQYEIDYYPHIFRRAWTLVNLGFVDTARVEHLKNHIASFCQIGNIRI